MKEFVFLFRGGLDFNTASPEQLQQSMMKWKVWLDDLAAQNIYLGGERLVPTGAVLNEQKQLSDGPYAEGKEIIAGYIALKANDLEAAVEISKGCPIFEYNGTLEVREIARM